MRTNHTVLVIALLGLQACSTNPDQTEVGASQPAITDEISVMAAPLNQAVLHIEHDQVLSQHVAAAEVKKTKQMMPAAMMERSSNLLADQIYWPAPGYQPETSAENYQTYLDNGVTNISPCPKMCRQRSWMRASYKRHIRP